MYVRHLQQFLESFTTGKKGQKGTVVSDAKIFVEKNGFLEEIMRIEVQENVSQLIGAPTHRLIFKTKNERKLILPDKLRGNYE
jgi:hypothetical protein